jgi:hypothetical protein
VAEVTGVDNENVEPTSPEAEPAVPEGEWLTLGEAAPRLGISVDALRRRLKRGQLTGRQIVTRYGPTWQVLLPNPGDPPTVTPTVAPALNDAPTLAPTVADGEGAGLADLVQLLRELREENRTLAGQLGYVQAQLEQSRERVRALEAPKVEQNEPERQDQPPEPPRRPWWWFWRSLTKAGRT